MYVADVLGSTDADTAQITVNPVPDRPGPFTIVTPILEEIDQWPDSLLFIWETPVDVDPGDALVYEWHLLKEGSSGDIPFKATVLDTMYCLFPGEEFDSGTYLWWVVVEDMYHLTRESNYGTIVVGSTGISHDGQDVPDAFDLLQNMPNPFNQQTRIPFHIPEPVHVIVHVFNAMGREICVLVDEKKEAGRYEAVWSTGSGSGTPDGSGMYIIRMEAGSYTAVRKILLVR